MVLTACGEPAEPREGTAQGSGSDTAVIERCFGAEATAETTERYNGMSEDVALTQARADSAGGGRVVARDDVCLARTLDLRAGRVNFAVQEGFVVWAAVERLPS